MAEPSPALFQGDRRRTKGWRTPDRIPEPLYAVVPIFNPYRWKSRWKLAARAIKHFMESGAIVYVVEAAFGQREFALDELAAHKELGDCRPIADALAPDCDHDDEHRGQHRYIRIRTKDELWLKENLVNVGVGFLPADWRYVCWLDADITFIRPNWVGETIHKLQHYAFLQMFSHARDVAPSYEILPASYPHADGLGFVRAHLDGQLAAAVNVGLPAAMLKTPAADYYGGRVWPGLCWATSRPYWDGVGGLLDIAVWGGADWHMAHALVGKRDTMMRSDLSVSYRAAVNAWADRCDRVVRRNVGAMTGTVLHHWHGRKTDRGYNTKHELLAQTGFDPTKHLKRDWQGVYQLHDDGSDNFLALRDGFRRVALTRHEDAIDL
jgi:hypothetical protein